MTTPRLSRLTLWLLAYAVPGRWRESIHGDLLEERERRHSLRLRVDALWQCGTVVAIGGRLLAESLFHRASLSPRRRCRTTLDQVWADIRSAVRSLAANPGYTALAVFTLALGIGANAAIFNVANWLLFRPTPGIERPDELVGIHLHQPSEGWRNSMSLAAIERLRTGAQALGGLAGTSSRLTAADVVVAGRQARRIDVDVVTDNFFDVLQVRPLIGRAFTIDEGRDPAMPPVAVISERFCRVEFGAADHAIGREIIVNGKPVRIVGVAPRGFRGIGLIGNIDLWLPGAQHHVAIPASYREPATEATAVNRPMFMTLLGRFAPGGNRDVLQSQLDAVHATLLAENPASRLYSQYQFGILPGLDTTSSERKEMHETLVMLLALSAALLALACANVGNSVMARSTSRAGEIATRLALGGSRLAVGRMLFIESLLLSFLASAGALALAWMVAHFIEGTVLVPGFAPLDLPAPDWRVAAWALALATVTAVGTGLSPMWSVRRADLTEALRQTARSHSPARQRLRTGLMAVQVAASVVLLVGAGLLVRSIVAKLSVDTGFDASRVLTFSVNPLLSADRPQPAFHQALVDRVRQVPGVRAASLAFLPPFHSGVEARLSFHTGDRPEPVMAARNAVRLGFFDAIGLAFVEGRDFAEAELDSPESIAQSPLILTESLARRVFGDSSAVGRTVTTAAGIQRTVVGVVRESRHRKLLSDDTGDIVFEPFRGDFRTPWVTVVIGTEAPDAVVWPGVRRAMAEIAPTLAMFNVMSVEEGIRAELGQDLLVAQIAPAFAGLAIVIAVVGFYGIVTRGVIERRRELGIRIALGAMRVDLMKIVTREVSAALMIGLAAGIVLSLWLSRFIESRLYGISRLDVASFAAAVLAIAIAVLLASIPAWRRATRLSPSAALRD